MKPAFATAALILALACASTPTSAAKPDLDLPQRESDAQSTLMANRFEEALQLDQALVEDAIRIEGPRSPTAISVLLSIYDIQSTLGNTDAAIESTRRALNMLPQETNTYASERQMIAQALADSLARKGEYEEAILVLSKNFDLLPLPEHKTDELRAFVWYSLAEYQHKSGHDEEARNAVTKALAMAEQAQNTGTLAFRIKVLRLAWSLVEPGNAKEAATLNAQLETEMNSAGTRLQIAEKQVAEPETSKAVDIQRAVTDAYVISTIMHGEDSPQSVHYLLKWGRLLADGPAWRTAKIVREVQTHLDKHVDVPAEDVANLMCLQAQVLARSGKFHEAEQLFDRALEKREKSSSPNDPDWRRNLLDYETAMTQSFESFFPLKKRVQLCRKMVEFSEQARDEKSDVSRYVSLSHLLAALGGLGADKEMAEERHAVRDKIATLYPDKPLIAEDTDLIGVWQVTYSPIAHFEVQQFVAFRADHTLQLYPACPDLGETLPTSATWTLKQGTLEVHYTPSSVTYTPQVRRMGNNLDTQEWGMAASRYVAMSRFTGTQIPGCTINAAMPDISMLERARKGESLEEEQVWHAANQAEWLRPYQIYTTLFPKGEHLEEAKKHIDAINQYLKAHRYRPAFYPVASAFYGIEPDPWVVLPSHVPNIIKPPAMIH